MTLDPRLCDESGEPITLEGMLRESYEQREAAARLVEAYQQRADEFIVGRVEILCGCGFYHDGFEAWQHCPSAMVPVQLTPWWRDPIGMLPVGMLDENSGQPIELGAFPLVLMALGVVAVAVIVALSVVYG